ncbi:MAG: NPCBM/NEW2 domain-containing protein [Pirellulales bacterium]
METSRWNRTRLLSVAALALFAARLQADPPRYCGAFADDAFVTDAVLTDWHDPAAQPKLAGRAVLDPAKPLRWLRSLAMAPPAAPRAMVELVGGDRLAGEVKSFRAQGESLYHSEWPAALVAPSGDLSLLGSKRPELVPVDLRWVRRIVWQRQTSDSYQPGTLMFRDGRRLSFRRVRLAGTRILALVESGPLEVPIEELAELHFPAVDPWRAYFDQLAAAGADGTSRLQTIETDDGARLTAPLNQFRALPGGNPGDASEWRHAIQPAWCSRPLVVPGARVFARRFFAAAEMPLSALEPTHFKQRPGAGAPWQPQVDRNVRGGLLTSSVREFGWGIGVQAHCELHFPLAECVTGFRTRAGLDKMAGRGGCARAVIKQGNDAPLFQSKHLVGASEVADSGTIVINVKPGETANLVLVADAAHDGRPAGADPFDVRDTLDWFEPIVLLDAGKLTAEIAKHPVRLVSAWEGWSIAEGKPVFASRYDESDPREPRYALELAPGAKPLALAARLRIGPDDRWLMLGVVQSVPGKPCRISVRFDGKPVAEFDAPTRHGASDPDPLLVPVDEFQNREVSVQIVHQPAEDQTRLAWRTVSLLAHPTRTHWSTIEPVRVESAEGSTLVAMPDMSLLATGKRPDRERMTITGKSPIGAVTAVRLELLMDESLPHNGPGRSYHGHAILTELKLTTSPPGKNVLARPITLQSAQADYHEGDFSAAKALDGNQGTGWSIGGGVGRPHVAIFELNDDGVPGEAIEANASLTFILDQQFGQGATLGRFRLSVTSDPLPLPGERRGIIVRGSGAEKDSRRKTLFDDEADLISKFDLRRSAAQVETGDRFAGSLALAVNKKPSGVTRLPGVVIAIREKPAAGEYRYVRFAWKTRGGTGIALTFAADGNWQTGGRSIRYWAGAVGMAPPEHALRAHDGRPDDWTVVTRDMFTDFGPLSITGFALDPLGGETALIDRIQFARSLDDFDSAR